MTWVHDTPWLKMVTERVSGGKAQSFRTNFATYLSDFGTTVAVRNITETQDSMGRTTSTTITNTNIKADIQWITKKDLQHLNVGDVEIGDGMLFVKYNATINIHDTVTFNSVRWKVTSQIEGEVVGDNVVYKGFIIRKDPQS